MDKMICFLIFVPLTKRDYERFGVELLQSRGFKVLFLDLTKAINANYLLNYEPSDPMDYENIVNIESKNKLEDFLRKNRNMFMIDLICGGEKALFIYRLLKKYGIEYASFCANSIPSPASCSIGGIKKRSLSEVILKRVKTILNLKEFTSKIIGILKEKYYKILYSLPLSLSRLQPPRLILAGGHLYTKREIRPDKKTEIIWAHTLDYDLYLANQNDTKQNDDYCVFLDEYFPYHPDLLVTGSESIDPPKYYEALNKYFDWFERKYSMPVIIAAHPRSQYDLKPDCFKGRRVEKGKTINLVSRARCVMTHGSTSVNFAVMYKKPIIFITTDELNSGYGRLMDGFAAQFDRKPINIDKREEHELTNPFEVDINKYSEYISNYIKIPGTPEKPFWDIVADRIEQGVET